MARASRSGRSLISNFFRWTELCRVFQPASIRPDHHSSEQFRSHRIQGRAEMFVGRGRLRRSFLPPSNFLPLPDSLINALAPISPDQRLTNVTGQPNKNKPRQTVMTTSDEVGGTVDSHTIPMTRLKMSVVLGVEGTESVGGRLRT